MQNIIIIGNAITADIIFSYLKNDKRYRVAGFAVDKDYIADKALHGLPVHDIATLADTASPQTHNIIIGAGYQKLNATRASLFTRVKDMGYTAETYIHENVHIQTDEDIGEGSIILPGSVIEPYAKIGKNSVIWANCTIAHHSVIGDHCWIASGTVIAGQGQIGDYSFVGVNATIANKVKIGAHNLIGAHTVIQKHTGENEVYLSRSGEKHRFPAKDYAAHLLQ